MVNGASSDSDADCSDGWRRPIESLWRHHEFFTAAGRQIGPSDGVPK